MKMNIGSKLQAAKTVVTSKAGRQVLILQKNSPHLMFGVGVVGVIATVALAAKATLDLDEVLDKREADVDRINEARQTVPDLYSAASQRSDLAKANLKTGLELTKLYGPAFVVGALSIGALTGAHVTLTRRNASLMAAYAVLNKGFNEYRSRVLNEVGEEKERELYHGVQEVEVISEKKSGEHVITRERRAAGRSMYAVLFDSSNLNHNPNPDTNLVFLMAAKASLNNLLQARGHVTLNDAYDQLGFPRTKAGYVVGWVKNNPRGDNYVDFGIWNDDAETLDQFFRFANGDEECIWLDFNVDGVILDQL